MFQYSIIPDDRDVQQTSQYLNGTSLMSKHSTRRKSKGCISISRCIANNCTELSWENVVWDEVIRPECEITCWLPIRELHSFLNVEYLEGVLETKARITR